MTNKKHEALLKELAAMNSRFTIEYEEDHESAEPSYYPYLREQREKDKTKTNEQQL